MDKVLSWDFFFLLSLNFFFFFFACMCDELVCSCVYVGRWSTTTRWSQRMPTRLCSPTARTKDVSSCDYRFITLQVPIDLIGQYWCCTNTLFTGKINEAVKEKIVEVVKAGGSLFQEHAVRQAVDMMWRQGKQRHRDSLPVNAAKQRYSYTLFGSFFCACVCDRLDF